MRIARRAAAGDRPVDRIYDLAIVGGGINGCGIARDAAGRGHSVILLEMNDLASGTSSWSTKLVHGGLRYLEYYEFRLVREALIEREVLWRIAPHLIRPLRFVLPHHDGLRPPWLLRLGLFLYDHLGGRKLLPPTRTVDLTRDEVGSPLQPGHYSLGFEYSDCFVDDARLVAMTARDAADRGAEIRTRCRVVEIRPADGVWQVTSEDHAGGRSTINARVLVNAGGPWVEQVLAAGSGVNARARIRLVQGSHIVVRRLYAHDRAYMFQNSDGRIVFVIPYQDDFTLIGTTDSDYHGDPAKVRASTEEIDYLCAAVSEYLARPVTTADVVWSYSGVRPLYDDGASEAKAATRDYVFELDLPGGAPLLSIYGGKITTYRRLAEEALRRLSPYLTDKDGASEGWTGKAPLPGGDFDVLAFSGLAGDLLRQYPFLRASEVNRLAHAYGTRTRKLLGEAKSRGDLGQAFGAGLHECEIRYLMEHEWARSAEDVVWRRSKLGLRLSAAEIAAINDWMARNKVD